jgi:hypothetical protein
LKVVVGHLKDKAEEIAAFLEPRVGTKPELSGAEIQIDDSTIRKGVRPRQVKTYLKRYLHKNNLRKQYTVRVSGSELTMVELEGKEEEEKKPEEAKKEVAAPPEKMEVKGDETKTAEAAERPKKEKPKDKKPTKKKK